MLFTLSRADAYLATCVTEGTRKANWDGGLATQQSLLRITCPLKASQDIPA